MRRFLLSLLLAIGLTGSMFAQQQKQPSDPYAPPPPAPKAPTEQNDKGCSGQATKGPAGGWKTSSTCPPATQNPVQDTPKLTTGQSSDKQPKKSTAEDNPFPEDVSQKAAEKAREAQQEKQAPPAASGESSSSDKTNGLDLEGEKEGRLSNGAGGIVHNPQLAEHDVHIGEFYLNREDYQGAYDRLKEATLADPANSDAVFYLAEAARHLNHKDEAVQNYQLYLSALPDGPKAKAARKALHELSAKR